MRYGESPSAGDFDPTDYINDQPDTYDPGDGWTLPADYHLAPDADSEVPPAGDYFDTDIIPTGEEPPAADYFGAQGEPVVYDKDGRPPAGNYIIAAHPDLAAEPSTPVAHPKGPVHVSGQTDGAGRDKTHTGDSRVRKALVAGTAVAAMSGISTALHAVGETKGIENTVESDYRGRNILHQDTDKGCLDGTPYEDTELDVRGVARPGDTTVTIPSADPELPDMNFRVYGSGSRRYVEASDPYTDTFVRFHGCAEDQ